VCVREREIDRERERREREREKGERESKMLCKQMSLSEFLGKGSTRLRIGRGEERGNRKRLKVGK